MPTNQPPQLTSSLNRGSGTLEKASAELRDRQSMWQGFSDALGLGVELVMTPLLFAAVGFGLDRWLGSGPLFALLLGCFGLVGVSLRTYYAYRARMEHEERGKPWTRPRP